MHFSHTAAGRRRARWLGTVGVTAVLAVALTACSGAGGSGQAAANSTADKYGTAAKPITLNFWSWGSTSPKPMVAAYEKLHPHIKLNVTLFGGTAPPYTKLATVLKAGTGAPDATGLELETLPTFAAGGKLVNLSKYGVNIADYDKSAAQASTIDKNVYAVPTDTGPLVMYYRTDVFKKLGLSVPTTWAEYMTDAEKIKSSGTGEIASIDPGDSSLLLGLMWQGGSRPFNLTGTDKLSINLADAGATKVASYWSTMLKQGLITAEPNWSTQWFNELADGHYATWLTGAWGGSTLAASIPKAAGDWKVATLPNWDASDPSNGVWGGSGTAVTAQSKHPAAAAAFADWFGSDWKLADVKDSANQPFPASKEVLTSKDFLSADSTFLGQKPDPLYIKASSQVGAGWQFLPYQLYANSIWADTVGQSITSNGDVAAGLAAWQKELATYGTQQGFTVTTGK